MAARRRKRKVQKKGESSDRGVRSAPLEPIRYVERELTRPDGTRLKVKVPVYPPFQLESESRPPAKPARARRKASERR